MINSISLPSPIIYLQLISYLGIMTLNSFENFIPEHHNTFFPSEEKINKYKKERETERISLRKRLIHLTLKKNNSTLLIYLMKIFNTLS